MGDNRIKANSAFVPLRHKIGTYIEKKNQTINNLVRSPCGGKLYIKTTKYINKSDIITNLMAAKLQVQNELRETVKKPK